MSGRARASMRKAACFVVCTLLCTALLASPGAWAQRAHDAGFAAKDQAERADEADRASSDALEQVASTKESIAQTNGPERADEQRTSDDQNRASTQDDSDALSQDDQSNAPSSNDQNKASTQDDQSDAATQDGQKSDTEADSSEKTDETSLAVAPKVGDEFQVPITIGNKPVNCWFRITSINPNEVAVGTHKGEHKGDGYTYYDSAIPQTTEGDIATLPTSVKDRLTNIEYRVTCVGNCAFNGCVKVTSTGLEGQTSITTLEHCAYAQSCIKDAGLGSNSTVKRIECAAFQRMDSLTSTGLTTNHTVSFIDDFAFYHDQNLGTVDTTGQSNPKDLVINQPKDNDKPVKLQIGNWAFAGSAYQRLYLLCDKENLTVSSQAFGTITQDRVCVTPFDVIYTNASWANTSTWSDAGKSFAQNDGTLVITSPSQTLSATRTPGTSDAARLTFTINRSFKADISHAGGTLVQNASFEADPTKPLTIKELALSGLPPSADELTVQITDPGQFVYPATATSRPYNSVGKKSLPYTLAPISYTIHFEVNGAAGSMADMQGVSYGSDTTLTPKPDEVFRENMQFDHWSTLQDDKDAGGQINLTRKDGAPIDNLSTLQGETVTLFAQWDIGLSILSFDKAKGPAAGALAGVGYTLKTTNDKKAKGMQGLFTLDAQGQKHPIQKDDWPLLSDTSGKVGMYYLPKGTYYLFNERASAGYTCLESSQRLVIDKKDGQIITTLDGVALEEQNTSPARISIAFEKVPSLPTTGTLPAGLLQAVGTLIAASTCIALIRRSRNRKHGAIK